MTPTDILIFLGVLFALAIIFYRKELFGRVGDQEDPNW